jgi:hypothetical protein
MSDELVMNEQHLEYLSPLQGLRYSTLDTGTRRRFSGTQIVAHVIEPQTPDEVKYDIFNRVNTGGSPLTAQEIRHCMSKTRSRNFLKALVELPSFDSATANAFWAKDPSGQLVRNNQRMADREMALRFCAFRSVPLSEYASATSLDAFLLDYTRRVDQAPDVGNSGLDLHLLKVAFDRAMENCAVILDKAAFRRWPLAAARRGPINRAVFESQALAMADLDLAALLPHRDDIVSRLRGLFDDPDYDNAVRSGTGDHRRVERRLRMPREVLAEILK